MKALELVPRHAFISERYQPLAYANRPLGIGYGQTISQPYIVALMTELLELKSCTNVLEVGTGCGYQTAVLAELVERVFTIEVVSDLATRAKKTLSELGYNTVDFRIGNGRDGWQEYAPFHAIIVTASSETIPLALINQFGNFTTLDIKHLNHNQRILCNIILNPGNGVKGIGINLTDAKIFWQCKSNNIKTIIRTYFNTI